MRTWDTVRVPHLIGPHLPYSSNKAPAVKQAALGDSIGGLGHLA